MVSEPAELLSRYRFFEMTGRITKPIYITGKIYV